MSLPKDLAGYQQIFSGVVSCGDIVLDSCFPYPQYAMEILAANPTIGTSLEEHLRVPSTLRFYRKMACPKQSDSHEAQFGAEGIQGHQATEISKAKTYDDGKPPLAWLPWDGLKEVAMVQAYGHAKYKDFNNFRKGMEVSRNLSCTIRHIAAYQEGEDLDPESKRNHLAHAACRLLFVLQNLKDGTAIDDRYKHA